MIDLCKHKNPCELTSEVQTDCQRARTVGRNITPIDSSQGVLGWTAAISFVGGKDADLCTSVDKKSDSRHWVRDVQKAARDDRASWICRSYRLEGSFPWWLQGVVQWRA